MKIPLIVKPTRKVNVLIHIFDIDSGIYGSRAELFRRLRITLRLDPLLGICSEYALPSSKYTCVIRRKCAVIHIDDLAKTTRPSIDELHDERWLIEWSKKYLIEGYTIKPFQQGDVYFVILNNECRPKKGKTAVIVGGRIGTHQLMITTNVAVRELTAFNGGITNAVFWLHYEPDLHPH